MHLGAFSTFFTWSGPNSQGTDLFALEEDWRSQISLFHLFRALFEGGFEPTTSWVELPCFSTVLAQIRRVGFFFTMMKIDEVRFHFFTHLGHFLRGEGVVVWTHYQSGWFFFWGPWLKWFKTSSKLHIWQYSEYLRWDLSPTTPDNGQRPFWVQNVLIFDPHVINWPPVVCGGD